MHKDRYVYFVHSSGPATAARLCKTLDWNNMNTTAEVMKKNWFSNLATGNARLTKAFYEAHLFWLLLLFILYWFLVPTIVSRLPITLEQATSYIFIPIIIFINIYVLFSLVAIWRCAFNVNNRLWGYLARTYAFVIFILTVYKYINNISTWIAFNLTRQSTTPGKPGSDPQKRCFFGPVTFNVMCI